VLLREETLCLRNDGNQQIEKQDLYEDHAKEEEAPRNVVEILCINCPEIREVT